MCRRTRKASLAGAPNRRPSGVTRKGLPSGGSLLKNTAPPASPPGGAGTPLPIKPGSGVQTTCLKIRQERKSPGADTGALIHSPSRLPGAPYTARERLTAAPSGLRIVVQEKSPCADIPSSEPARLAPSRVSQTAGRPLQPRRAGMMSILDEKAKDKGILSV